MTRTCTIRDVGLFEKCAKPGDTLVYFTGLSVPEALANASSPTLRSVINLVRRLANDGQVDLVQARCSGGFEYRAIWRRRHRPIEKAFQFEMAE